MHIEYLKCIKEAQKAIILFLLALDCTLNLEIFRTLRMVLRNQKIVFGHVQIQR